MVAHNLQFQEETRNNHKNTTASIKNLEVQLGHVAQQISSSQTPGSLPCETFQNPRNHENVNVVTMRSEKATKDEKVIPPGKPTEEKNKKETKPVIKLPYPQRVTKKDPRDTDFEKFMTMFKTIESHMPLFEALERMPMLSIENVNDTRTNLKFAVHSIKNAYGIVEDVLVTIGELSFPVDFVIIDMPEDEETPIILGQPFIRTSRCNLDMDQGTLTFNVHDDEITLNAIENRKLDSKKHDSTKKVTDLEDESSDDEDDSLLHHLKPSMAKSMKTRNGRFVAEVMTAKTAKNATTIGPSKSWSKVEVRKRKVREISESDEDVEEDIPDISPVKRTTVRKSPAKVAACYEGLVKEFVVNIPKDIAEKNSKEFCKVFVMLKVMSDGEVYVTDDVEGGVCVERTEGEEKHKRMCV
ncbi:uncharacterized protein LOC127079269 [Lathyrus oleraceus]|uniref:uncharacterized protein LOC127079269 n=1 Tax=Pisum sativum TaxID=3888 RepID=UPI0021CEB09D|nr:uncharacterized protein LOC127079269 [Pisum sativum]